MSILLTGFEPFDGADTNPSWEAVSRMADQIAGHAVHRLRLPVVYGEAAKMLLREIALIRPEIVVCCGVAGGRQAVTPELVAINHRHARIPDNAGQQYSAQPIDEGGPAAYMTQLPVYDMIDAMKAAEIPAYLSLSAGAYVCNDVYFALLASEADLGHRGMFIHVPGVDVVDADAAARAITLCLETALDAQGGRHADR